MARMTSKQAKTTPAWPVGGGEMGGCIRAFDWAATPLGAMDAWPRSLRTAIDLMLGAAQPVYIGWGPQLISLFNDSYVPILGDKHPGALGKPLAELFAEIWDEFGSIAAAVMAGDAQYSVDRPVALDARPGRPVSWFTYSWTPLRDDAGTVSGFYCAAVETTDRVLAQQAQREREQAALAAADAERAEAIGRAERSDALLVQERRLMERIAAGAPLAEILTELTQGFESRFAERAPRASVLLVDEDGRHLRHGAAPSLPAAYRRAIDGQAIGEGTGSCGTAAFRGARVIVQDIATDPLWTDYADLALSHGLGACWSTPIVGSEGQVLGTFAIYYLVPKAPTAEEMEAVDFLNRATAIAIERHRADEALRRSEGKYRTLFDSVDAGFCIIEVLFDGRSKPIDYRFLEANPAFERHTGLVNATGRRMRELAPDHEAHWFEIYGEIALTGIPRRFEDPAEALERYFDVYAFRIGDPDRHQVAILFNDISERRRSEMALREASRAKDEFLAMLGHELRNPLAPIMSHLQLMRLREPDCLVRDREIIEEQVRHMVALVDDLLDVSRIARGKVELKKLPVELAGIIAQAIETVSPLLEKNNQDIEKAVEAGLVVDGDARRLVQVVINLLSNATKYSSPRDVISISASAEGDEAVLRVRDQGVGIEPDLMPRIFDLFAQSAQSIDRANGGLGLGLAIVHNLVTLHGGSVEAHSEGRNRGSEFIVRLPLLEQQTTDDAPRPVQPSAAEGGTDKAKVLVVDDYADAAAALAEVLEMDGYETRIAHDGAAALRIATEFVPAVALIDIGLPVMDGYEVARRLRETPGLEKTRLVAVTGYGQESDRRAAREAGFDEHVVKPLDPAAIGELVGRHATAAAIGLGY
ncbi:MAG TPA: ATP-binding protein [Gammaproteobacteria bacterium]|nr:ATP-binding protein [Gammaproteobacteria bacterium]